MKTIGIIGLGIMGHGMAKNFITADYPVYVWNRTTSKATELVEMGAAMATSPRELTEKCDIVFEVTANDASSQSVWQGDEGILAGATADKTLITAATLSVEWVDELTKMCADQGFTFMDMPLTGSRPGAESGNLTLLVGADKEKLHAIMDELDVISKLIHHFGPAGMGTRYKLILNMLQSIHVTGFGEALRLAKKVGLNVDQVGNILAEIPGGTSTKFVWSSYDNPPDPVSFALQWVTKDLSYAKAMAENMDVPVLDSALSHYQSALEDGHGEDDWSYVVKKGE